MFTLVVEHLLKNVHRYFHTEKPTAFQKQVIAKQYLSPELLAIVIDEHKEANKKVREACEMKSKGRVHEHEQVVEQIKGKFGTFCNLSTMSGVPLKTVHAWCSTAKEKTHKASEFAKIRRAEFERFLCQDSISFEHPSKRYANKRYLRFTWEVIREKYLAQKEYHTNGILAVSTMKFYRPDYIKLCEDTPSDVCLCDKCENVENILKTLIGLGLKLPGNKFKLVDYIVCDDRNLQDGSLFECPKKNCIEGVCNQCGIKLLQEKVYISPGYQLQEKHCITWKRWVRLPGCSAPKNVEIRGTVEQAFDQLLSLLKPLRSHIFRMNWHRNLFEIIRKNLLYGYVAQIFDFSMNFRNAIQDQIQSAFWEST